MPSFYYEVRSEPEMVARRNWKREWWDRRSAGYELVTSEALLEELGGGEYPQKDAAIALVDSLPTLSTSGEVPEIAAVYVAQMVMPRAPVGDAMHLALASFYKCDFLLTWNCRHLANDSKFERIREVNTRLGLFVPTLVTPLEMLGETYYEESRTERWVVGAPRPIPFLWGPPRASGPYAPRARRGGLFLNGRLSVSIRQTIRVSLCATITSASRCVCRFLRALA